MVELKILKVTTQRILQNGYIIVGLNEQAIIIDPGSDAELYKKHLRAMNLELQAIIVTHGHYDHVGAISALQNSSPVDFFIHEKDISMLKQARLFSKFIGAQEVFIPPTPNRIISGFNGTLQIAGLKIDWFHAPGHTPGSVCFTIGKNIFTGDLLLPKNHFSNKLPGASKEQLKLSIKMLENIDKNMTAFPGHGKNCSLSVILDRMGSKC
jgi:hydroxyacylglutathione hydrolase